MKKQYDQPEVLISQITMDSMILAGSPAGNVMTFQSTIPTDDQW